MMNRFQHTDLFSTYSIIARDPETGQLGGAVQTHQMGVGRLIPFLQPGVGVIASQSLVNIHYNPVALTMLKEGYEPVDILDALTASDPNSHRRQVAVLNNKGAVAAFTGEGCIREAAHILGEGYSIQANMMTKTTVLAAMQTAFEDTEGDLAARMLAALKAAQREDGDIRGMQSAALKVISGEVTASEYTPIYDLRVDEHDNPIEELARLVRIRHAQLIDSQGYALLDAGKVPEALRIWQSARDKAPDQEELGFWQAVTLADKYPTDNAVELAAVIFNEAMKNNHRLAHWLDLIQRLHECGLIQRSGAAAELLQAIKEQA